MPRSQIQYRSGYKYQLESDYVVLTTIKPKQDIDTKYIALTTAGVLTVKCGYAWDGTSGPVMDTEENLRASLVHDAFYQLMRRRNLRPIKTYKDKADKLFRSMCKEDGVFSPVAQLYYEALKKFGKPATEPANVKPILFAPE